MRCLPLRVNWMWSNIEEGLDPPFEWDPSMSHGRRAAA